MAASGRCPFRSKPFHEKADPSRFGFLSPLFRPRKFTHSSHRQPLSQLRIRITAVNRDGKKNDENNCLLWAMISKITPRGVIRF